MRMWDPKTNWQMTLICSSELRRGRQRSGTSKGRWGSQVDEKEQTSGEQILAGGPRNEGTPQGVR